MPVLSAAAPTARIATPTAVTAVPTVVHASRLYLADWTSRPRPVSAFAVPAGRASMDLVASPIWRLKSATSAIRRTRTVRSATGSPLPLVRSAVQWRDGDRVARRPGRPRYRSLRGARHWRGAEHREQAEEGDRGRASDPRCRLRRQGERRREDDLGLTALRAVRP